MKAKQALFLDEGSLLSIQDAVVLFRPV